MESNKYRKRKCAFQIPIICQTLCACKEIMFSLVWGESSGALHAKINGQHQLFPAWELTSPDGSLKQLVNWFEGLFEKISWKYLKIVTVSVSIRFILERDYLSVSFSVVKLSEFYYNLVMRERPKRNFNKDGTFGKWNCHFIKKRNIWKLKQPTLFWILKEIF